MLVLPDTIAIIVPAFQRVSPDVNPGPGDRRPE